ncbi:MAG: protein kinase [Chlamydiales bacterium]|nr:protein kinase [Chlamydiia bacterium]MCP5507530.1 protein kinase [Chlamydiales bacterium]
MSDDLSPISSSSQSEYQKLPEALKLTGKGEFFSVELKDVDEKTVILQAYIHEPAESSKNFIPLHIGKEKRKVWVKASELEKATGISKDILCRSSNPEEIISKRQHLLEVVRRTADAAEKFFKLSKEETLPHLMKAATDEKQFRGGTVSPIKAAEQMYKLSEEEHKGKLLSVLLFNFRDVEGYFPKQKLALGVAPSLKFVEGKAVFGSKKIGEGGSAKVSDTETVSFQSQKYVKVVARDRKGKEKSVEQLKRHLSIVEQLNKSGVKHVPKVHSFEFMTTTKKHEPKLVVLVNRLEGDVGMKLEEHVKRKEAMPAAETAKLLEYTAEALAGCHENGIVHSDIKPGNILLDSDGNAVLHDFGIAKEKDNYIIGGTRAYLPPEALTTDRKLNVFSTLKPSFDLFSLGVTLMQLTSGTYLLEEGSIESEIDQYSENVLHSEEILLSEEFSEDFDLDSEASSSEPLTVFGNKIYAEAEDDQEIQNNINEVRQAVLDVMNPLPPEDKIYRIMLLDLAKDLLRINPDERPSAAEVHQRLVDINKICRQAIESGRVEDHLR